MTMNAYLSLVAAWHENLGITRGSRAFTLLGSGELTRRQYAAMLRQVFHCVRDNPQMVALATNRFRGEQRTMVKKFLRHAASEVGHDELALQDMAAVGEDISGVPFERPQPATFALIASVFHTVEHHEPVAILGYMFHLEYTATQLGGGYIAALTKAGFPPESMTFLAEHAEVDVAHCKLIEEYCEVLLRTPEQLQAALYVQRLTAELYASMLDQAIERARVDVILAGATGDRVEP